MDYKVLKKLSIFVVAFIVVNLAINTIYLDIMSISRLDRSVNQLQAYGDTIDRLVLGDSHSQRDFDPAELENAFNFSSVGENYIQSYYKLKRLIDEGKQISSVIIPVDLHSFSSYRSDDFRDSYFWVDYIDYFELGLEKGELPTFLLLSIKGRFFPYSDGGKKNIFDFVTRGMKQEDMDRGFVGYGGDFSRKKDPSSIAQERADYHLKNENSLEPITLTYFNKLLKLAAEHDVELNLVKCPVTLEYYLHAKELVNVNEFYAVIEAKAAAYENVRIIDFQGAFFNQNHYFYDPDHLNKDGAREFSARLNDRLASLATTRQVDKLVEAAE